MSALQYALKQYGIPASHSAAARGGTYLVGEPPITRALAAYGRAERAKPKGRAVPPSRGRPRLSTPLEKGERADRPRSSALAVHRHVSLSGQQRLQLQLDRGLDQRAQDVLI